MAQLCVLWHPRWMTRWIAALGFAALVPATKDDFTIFATAVGASIRFTRDRRGRVTGFALRSGSMHGLRFDRVR